MHSSLVVTPEGLPLGIAAAKFWTRKKFKGTNELKRTINLTRIPIEAKESVRWLENMKEASALLQVPQRCVHIGDRESDIFELFCAANELDTRFLIRICNDRLVGDGNARAKRGANHCYLIRLARLGGYLDRARDPMPGNMVIWRGLSRLTDIQVGFQMAIELMGN